MTGDPRLPTFVVIGAQKCGTTTLATVLGRHPDVFMTDPKEPGFFDGRTKHAGDLEWYHDLFADAGAAPARGEASTTYTCAPVFSDVPARIRAMVPDARLIYLIRDPIARVESHYLMRLRNGEAEGDLAHVVRTQREYVDISSYGHQVAAYLEHFERDAVLVLRLEDLGDEPEAVMTRSLHFVGVDPDKLDATDEVRENTRPPGRQRRPVRVPKALRPWLERAPRGLKRELKSTVRRTVGAEETTLPADLRAELTETFAEDLAILRPIVGDDFDLYGLA